MSILITGAAGFIGSHFVQCLLRKSDSAIVALDNFNDYYDPARKRANAALFADDPRVTLIEGDFCDTEFVFRLFQEYQFEFVVHLGAYAGVRYSMDHPTIYQQVNVCGTANLLEAARRRPVERFLLASSSTVYGDGAAVPFREDAPLGTPTSPYGSSKRAAELLAQMYYEVHDVPTVSLRLFSVYGPRLRPDLAMAIFVERIARGEPLPLFGDGSIRRDFTHVDDVCRGLLAAMTAPGAIGKAINLGSDRPVAMSQLIEMLARQLGRKPNILSRPAHPGDLAATHADLARARELLGYEPCVPLADGLKEYVAWFRRLQGVATCP
ncbi:MAG: GDP-mannose 4,6-dehydratase [Planctomycetia bacterium]|nr:GDP-mannose 4,6-dehydratase [Planctomycetia bacterium]